MTKELVEEIAEYIGLNLGEIRREIRKEYERDYERYFFDQIWGQLSDIEERAVILAEYLSEDFATALSYVEDEDYLVLTDDGAENRWEDEIYNYIEECVLPEIPHKYQDYFDKDKFVDDCRGDSRGHSLAKYDGYENYHNFNDCTYYIYRIN